MMFCLITKLSIFSLFCRRSFSSGCFVLLLHWYVLNHSFWKGPIPCSVDCHLMKTAAVFCVWCFYRAKLSFYFFLSFKVFRCGLELCIKLSWVRSKVSFGCCVVLRVSKNIRRSFFNTKSNDWTSELPLILVRPGYPIYFLLLWAQRMRSTVTRQVYFTSSTEAAKLAES